MYRTETVHSVQSITFKFAFPWQCSISMTSLLTYKWCYVMGYGNLKFKSESTLAVSLNGRRSAFANCLRVCWQLLLSSHQQACDRMCHIIHSHMFYVIDIRAYFHRLAICRILTKSWRKRLKYFQGGVLLSVT